MPLVLLLGCARLAAGSAVFTAMVQKFSSYIWYSIYSRIIYLGVFAKAGVTQFPVAQSDTNKYYYIFANPTSTLIKDVYVLRYVHECWIFERAMHIMLVLYIVAAYRVLHHHHQQQEQQQQHRIIWFENNYTTHARIYGNDQKHRAGALCEKASLKFACNKRKQRQQRSRTAAAAPVTARKTSGTKCQSNRIINLRVDQTSHPTYIPTGAIQHQPP